MDARPYDRTGMKVSDGVESSALGCGEQCVADVDEVVGDDAKADPALDAGKGLLRLGMATRLTPRAWAAASLRWEKAASAVTR
jgi:hypothetical protein